MARSQSGACAANTVRLPTFALVRCGVFFGTGVISDACSGMDPWLYSRIIAAPEGTQVEQVPVAGAERPERDPAQ